MLLFSKSPHTRNVSDYVRRVASVYDVDTLIQQPIRPDDVVDYYVQSHVGYRLLHSLNGSIHMAVSQGEQFRFEDYLAQVRFIEGQIVAHQSQTVVELGCGNGFNLLHLANRFGEQQFTGLDITPLHIKNGMRRAKQKQLKNIDFELGDFHNLDYPAASVDMVFAIESICHAQDIFRVMSEVHRVLKPGGIMIVFDGFRVREHCLLTPDEKMARYLIEKTLAVNESQQIQSYISGSQELGFSVLEHTDLSRAILPNLERFHDLARLLFEISPLGHVARILLPVHLTRNAIAAYLMPILVGNGIQGYFRLCYQKPKSSEDVADE